MTDAPVPEATEGSDDPLAQCRLYTFIDTAFLRGRDPAGIARELCAGGSDLVQLRAKNATPGEILGGSLTLFIPFSKEAGVGLVINDHYEIARQVGAEWCHLGQEDFFGAGWATSAGLAGGRPAPRLLG